LFEEDVFVVHLDSIVGPPSAFRGMKYVMLSMAGLLAGLKPRHTV